MDDLLRNWKHKADAGTMLKRNLYLNTSLFADDQVIIQDSKQTPEICLYVKPNKQRLQPQNIYGQNKKLWLLKENI